VKFVKVDKNPAKVIATKVKAKVTPPMRPLRSVVELSPKNAKQEGNPKPKDNPSSNETAQVTGTAEELKKIISADAQTPKIIHSDNRLLRPIFSTKWFPRKAEPAIAA
jgi:hypothetical protein